MREIHRAHVFEHIHLRDGFGDGIGDLVGDLAAIRAIDFVAVVRAGVVTSGHVDADRAT